jgi:hypothetical protein
MSVWSLTSRPFGLARVRVALALVALFLAVGGCGTGGTTTTQTQYYMQAIGPAGGVAAAGPVNLQIPPGALLQDTSVAILPELNPYLIQAPAGDPCVYTYLGPIHCIGPIAMPLAVDGVLRVGYDESLIPLGSTEGDLVLLIWDEANWVMVPKTGPSVVQDQVLNFFEDTAYDELGHVAIGVRSCPLGLILVQNNPLLMQAKPAVAEGPTAGGPELYIVDPLALSAPALVDTSFLPFSSFLASPSGDRVLLLSSSAQKQGSALYTLPLPGGGSPVEVFAEDVDANLFLQAYDPFFGWLKGSAQDEVFAVFYHPTLMSMGAPTGPLNAYELHRRDALAASSAVEMYERDAEVYYPDDLRQSDDGAGAMFRWGASLSEFSQAPAALFPAGVVDVLASPSGAPDSLAEIQPNSSGSSPRFMTLSSDLYVISNGTLVERWERDGDFVGTLFDPGFDGETLVDFALAPDDETFAMVVDVEVFIGDLQQGFSTIQTELRMGTLTDGVLATHYFYSQQYVDELVWHPQQTGVFLDVSGFWTGFYRLLNDKGDYITELSLPVYGMQHVDVNRVDGRILVLINGLDVSLTTAETIPLGLYVSPADGSDFQFVDMPGLFDPIQARWIESWRNQPGMGSPRVR